MKTYLGCALLAGLVAAPIATKADEPVSLTVSPAVATYRGSTMLKVLVERDASNRQLTWEIDGPQYYRSSSVNLDGAAAPRAHTFTVRELPAGEYEVRAILIRADRSQLVDRKIMRVVGGPE